MSAPHTHMITSVNSALIDSYDQVLWYAGYTASRHEKQVARHFQEREIEYFLPLYDTVHRWRNGRHSLQLPLFPGYIFVHMRLRDRFRVLEVPGMLRFVHFSGLPCPLSEAEISAVRLACSGGGCPKPHPYLAAGTRVEICKGPLQGTRGILLRRSGKYRVVISVDLIMRSLVVEVGADEVVPLSNWAQARSAVQPVA